ncbi:hypothetical protein KJ359_005275 [Pestalotiopsis sp. 9143b]|nr:hypothetical protein KJ359_005275 [Pestalotiopsis sp. 9143b]
MPGYGRSQPQQAEDPETSQQDYQDEMAWRQMIMEQRHRIADLQASQWSNQDQLHDDRRSNEKPSEEAQQRESQRQQNLRSVTEQALTYTQHQQHVQYGQQYPQQYSQSQYAPSAHQRHLYRQHILMHENRERMRAEENLRQQQQPQWTHDPHQYAAATQGHCHQQDNDYEDEGYEDDGHDDDYSAYGQASHQQQQQHQHDANWYNRQHHRGY